MGFFDSFTSSIFTDFYNLVDSTVTTVTDFITGAESSDSPPPTTDFDSGSNTVTDLVTEVAIASVTSSSNLSPAAFTPLILGNQSFQTPDGVDVFFNVWNDGDRDATGQVNPNAYTFAIAHGFTSTGGNPDNNYEPTSWMANLANHLEAMPDGEDANIILIDWADGAGIFSGSFFDIFSWDLGAYGPSARHTQQVGDVVAEYLHDNGFNPDRTAIIGHSLGAQLAGDAGEHYQQISGGDELGTIIGLDPAGPEFEGKGNDEILSPDDADRVIGIHTSDPYGYDDDLGDYDLFVNATFSRPSWFDDGLDYDHPGMSQEWSPWGGIEAHAYSHTLLTSLFAGDRYTEPGSGDTLDLASLLDGNGREVFQTNGAAVANVGFGSNPFAVA